MVPDHAICATFARPPIIPKAATSPSDTIVTTSQSSHVITGRQLFPDFTFRDPWRCDRVLKRTDHGY